MFVSILVNIFLKFIVLLLLLLLHKYTKCARLVVDWYKWGSAAI
jgi:hypothetical protein